MYIIHTVFYTIKYCILITVFPHPCLMNRVLLYNKNFSIIYLNELFCFLKIWKPLLFWSYQKWAEGFPGGAVVENLPANVGDTGSSPGLGRSHMPRSNWAHEPQLLSLRVWSLSSTIREAVVVRGTAIMRGTLQHTAMKSGPRSPQLEKALAQKRRPNTAKNK